MLATGIADIPGIPIVARITVITIFPTSAEKNILLGRDSQKCENGC